MLNIRKYRPVPSKAVFKGGDGFGGFNPLDVFLSIGNTSTNIIKKKLFKKPIKKKSSSLVRFISPHEG